VVRSSTHHLPRRTVYSGCLSLSEVIITWSHSCAISHLLSINRCWACHDWSASTTAYVRIAWTLAAHSMMGCHLTFRIRSIDASSSHTWIPVWIWRLLKLGSPWLIYINWSILIRNRCLIESASIICLDTIHESMSVNNQIESTSTIRSHLSKYDIFRDTRKRVIFAKESCF